MRITEEHAEMDAYLYPAECCGPKERPVPLMRIAEKVNDCMSRRDYAGVERVLRYWLEEARLRGDGMGQMMLCGELAGHYRKTGEKKKALDIAQEGLRLFRELKEETSVSGATVLINIATAYHTFGLYEKALPLFEQARNTYERTETDAALRGGLYNNMGLTCAAMGRWTEAGALYDLAMEQMRQVPHGELEQAVTCLNRADAVEARDGAEAGEKEIFALLERAEALLETPSLPRDGYYAYVCAACAPTFAHYGYFFFADELKRRAEEIYERA